MDDGVAFDTDARKLQMIREEQDYHGIRVRVPAAIATAELTLALDISFDEYVEPKEIVVPTLLDDHDFQLLGYPEESVIAEKVETMIALGDANTRDRDWADVLRLAGTRDFRADDLLEALQGTAASRRRELAPLRTVITTLGDRRQGNWQALLERRHEQAFLPESFTEAIAEVIAFIDPVIEGRVVGLAWSPSARAWA
jgi:hypothetical protein